MTHKQRPNYIYVYIQLWSSRTSAIHVLCRVAKRNGLKADVDSIQRRRALVYGVRWTDARARRRYHKKIRLYSRRDLGVETTVRAVSRGGGRRKGRRRVVCSGAAVGKPFFIYSYGQNVTYISDGRAPARRTARGFHYPRPNRLISYTIVGGVPKPRLPDERRETPIFRYYFTCRHVRFSVVGGLES